MNKIFYILILFLVIEKGASQSTPTLTQFMFNPLIYNPAYAGAQDDPVAVLQSRIQWLGVSDINPPVTNSFSLHSLLDNEINGIGGNVIVDNSYNLKQTHVTAFFSHRIIFKKSTLSMGLNGGVEFIETNFSDLLLKNPDDGSFNSNVSSNKSQPNFGVGLYHYSDKHYFGLSSPSLLKSKVGVGSSQQRITYYLNMGYVLSLGKTVKVKPNAQIKYVQGAPLQIDVNANVLVFNVLWFGFSYRSLESLDLLLEIHFTPKMRVGYSYDLGLNDFSKYNNGSHEFMLSYKFGKKIEKGINKTYSPRYF